MLKKTEPKREGWTYINLPKELANKIDVILELRLDGCRSRGDFIADAVRRRLDELKKTEWRALASAARASYQFLYVVILLLSLHSTNFRNPSFKENLG